MRPLLLGLAALMLSPDPSRLDDESVYLLASDDVKQFDLVGIGPEAIEIKEKEIRLTGRPNGYFATRESYSNYVLKFEWMYEKPEGVGAKEPFQGNSGILLHLDGPPKVWPKCVEAQLLYADAGSLYPINGAKFAGEIDKEAQAKAIKPVGQWNEVEIRCEGGKITSILNGVQVATGAGASPSRGPIGFQSEGVPIRFRYLRIKATD